MRLRPGACRKKVSDLPISQTCRMAWPLACCLIGERADGQEVEPVDRFHAGNGTNAPSDVLAVLL